MRTLPLTLLLLLPTAHAAAPQTAEEIVAFATAAAGGEAWLNASTNIMSGHATLCRDGNPNACVTADDYIMWREYPTEITDVHAGTGRFRLDAKVQGRVLFQTSFDGTDSWSHLGKVPPDQARESQESNFGFSAIRFAGREGFPVDRLVDDTMEGRDAWVIRVGDPSGGKTLFWIDKETGLILAAAWDTPRGWHQRTYGDYYEIGNTGFMQPEHVRLYYNGIKANDIRWTQASINEPLEEGLFRLDGD